MKQIIETENIKSFSKETKIIKNIKEEHFIIKIENKNSIEDILDFYSGKAGKMPLF